MNKHQTFAYIKYGKLANKINDEIIDHDIKNDMINFLANFPGTLKYPNRLNLFNPRNQFNPRPEYIPFNLYLKINILKRMADRKNSRLGVRVHGRMTFFFDLPPSPLLLYSIELIFDGKNNLQLWFYKKSLRKYKWTSFNDLENYVNIHHDVFSKITN